MKWKLVKNEMPPLGEFLLIGRSGYRGDKKCILDWCRAKVFRPYDEDEEWNPDLYKLIYFDNESSEWKKEILAPYMFWMLIENPIHPDYADKIEF